MAQLLFKLGRWSFRWKWIVIVAWLLIFVAVWAAQTSLQRGFNDQLASLAAIAVVAVVASWISVRSIRAMDAGSLLKEGE